MGYPGPRPKRLAAKLFLIRRRLGLSQPNLAKLIGVKEYTDISSTSGTLTKPRSTFFWLTPAPLKSRLNRSLTMNRACLFDRFHIKGVMCIFGRNTLTLAVIIK